MHPLAMFNDLRYAFRQLLKNPGFSAVAILALAIGIAVNTAIFTAYNAVALRPIQATKPDSLVNIHASALADHYDGGAFSYPDYVHYRDHNSVFSGLIAASGTGLRLNDAPEASNTAAPGGGISGIAGIRFFQQMAGSAELIRAALVSENYFSARPKRTGRAVTRLCCSVTVCGNDSLAPTLVLWGARSSSMSRAIR